ncbi:hypothetical protein [Moorena sp. SIO4G3]|nr:hypothetical protein [Moorena sp. SIO4G3]NEO76815.1 hypothetical protein [Moorena sp. SIO4G3]
MGETTPVAHGGDPQDRTGSPRPRCIACRVSFRFFFTENERIVGTEEPHL